jgi:hypothetical protein
MSNRVRGGCVLLSTMTLCAAAGAAGAARGQNISWSSDGMPQAPGILPSIFLTDNNVSAVDQFLATQPVKAIKIPTDISPATVSAIYNKYKIDYTFADLEGTDSLTHITSLVNQIKASTGTGPAFVANKAYVSNFALAPLYGDATGGGPSGVSMSQYLSTGVNMASEELYPGSPGFRGPASGNSTAPNIRSALFALPITRLSMVSANLPSGQPHIAYVDRFNNWLNNALDSDGDPSNGYQFVTKDQLPSRGDFQAQVLHYRLRGATGVHGLDGGVVGYTIAQFERDINQGWNGVAAVNQILADPGARLASIDTQVQTDGVMKSLENTGVVYSGAYSSSLGKLVLLLSNLDEESHKLSFPAKLGGKYVPGEYNVLAGSHEILEFGAAGTNWSLLSASAVFEDSDRAGVGIPEPSIAALGVGAMIAMRSGRGRKRRR